VEKGGHGGILLFAFTYRPASVSTRAELSGGPGHHVPHPKIDGTATGPSGGTIDPGLKSPGGNPAIDIDHVQVRSNYGFAL